MMPVWIKKYIGLPYSIEKDSNGFDCWGIYREIYKNEKGIILPKNDFYVNADHIASVELAIEHDKENWEKIQNPELFSLILMNIMGHPIHLGMYLDETYMIHTLKGHNSAIERYNSFKWKKRIEGFYNHKLRVQ